MHCDDLIDDPAQPDCVRKFLAYKRAPAIEQTLSDAELPKLFATLKKDVKGQSYLGFWRGTEPAMVDVPMTSGQRVRVVMASRFGDVGITPKLEDVRGYAARLFLDDLTDFSSDPSHLRQHD